MQHKILIVEDEEIIRLGLQDNFELENYIVETAADGDEAVAKADSFLPHLVILDLMIPKKSGFEVCRIIRKKHPECFIIMLTAKTEETSKVAGLEMGADDYVTKPFSILEPREGIPPPHRSRRPAGTCRPADAGLHRLCRHPPGFQEV